MTRAAGASARDTGRRIAVMLHIDAGGNNQTCRWFLENILAQKVPFDVIGLSYYPWWHGSLDDLRRNLNDLGTRYGKPVMVVETAYPWTLDSCDAMRNLVGRTSQLPSGFPATARGQRDFLMEERSIIENVPFSRGAGMFYWAPEYISVPGLESVWENVTLFDFQGRALISLNSFADSDTNSSLRNVQPQE